MQYLIIDILYLVLIWGIYKIRHSSNQMIRMLDNGYAFYESLPKSQKEFYWKKDTQLLMGFMLGIGICINIMFYQIELGASLLIIIGIFLLGIVISTGIYTYLYFRLKRKYIKNDYLDYDCNFWSFVNCFLHGERCFLDCGL